MKVLSAEARKATVRATSSALATRPSGVAACQRLRDSDSASCIPALTGPGATALTRMPWGPSSTASARASDSMAPLHMA
ncbi:hypothetical protein [Halomonas sp. E19]|uniref:hypothetical protein n=1 Tax=Halomonas sp. E19 TaxID=3397247 RepID=UPI004033CA29